MNINNNELIKLITFQSIINKSSIKENKYWPATPLEKNDSLQTLRVISPENAGGDSDDVIFVVNESTTCVRAVDCDGY